MRKKVGRAPEEFCAGPFLFLFEHCDYRIEVPIGFGKGPAFGGDVTVVEAIEGSAKLLNEFKRRSNASLGILNRVGAVIPGAQRRSLAEGIAEGIAHRVPVAHGKTEVLAHGFAFDLLVGRVMLEGERVAGVRSFKEDGADVGKKFGFLVFHG